MYLLFHITLSFVILTVLLIEFSSDKILTRNKYIKVKGQSLLFNNWIDSNLIYINDLLDEKRNLSEEFIFKKLKCKVNWISELYT
jgi:hypothetical protein